MPYCKRSTGRYCSVSGCSNSNRRLYEWKNADCPIHVDLKHMDCACLVPYGFHSFPKDPSKRREWIAKLNRKNYVPGKYAVVCSMHFIDHRPTPRNPFPALLLGYDTRTPVKPGRRLLVKKRGYLESKKPRTCAEENEILQLSEDAAPQEITENQSIVIPGLASNSCTESSIQRECQVSKCDKSTQWDMCDFKSDHAYAADRIENQSKEKTFNSCGTQESMPCFMTKLMSDNDYKFYTGLSMQVFLCLVSTMNLVAINKFTKLSIHDQLLLVLCRLRLGLLFGDLGKRLNVSTSFATRVFNFWIQAMAKNLRSLVCWLPRDIIRETLPDCFKAKYPLTTCVIDCTEVIMERSRSHWVRAVTYSNYKGRNTIKFLVAIAPNGFIMLVSECFGGRTSDKYITEHSGFLKYLLPGDQVMADRGFLIEELLPPNVRLNMPPFKPRGASQIPGFEVTRGRRVATVRVHIERVIAQMKNFRILKNCFPISQSKKIDDIIVLCAALCNLQKSVVPQKKKL